MSSERPLEVAHVLFMDIVSYSRLPTDRQPEILAELQDLVRSTPEFQTASASGQIVSLPTGDGMALAFFGDPTVPVRCARNLAVELKSRPHIPLRMGLHAGPVYRVADINANRNVSGGGINFAQRVMDCGDAGHIIVSGAVADTLLQLSEWRDSVHDLGDVPVKHGAIVHLYNLYSSNFGNPATPAKVAASGKQQQRSEPNLGRLVAKLCDRRAQEEDFQQTFLDALDRHPGSPQLYFITGEEGQCHESLVERLIHRAGIASASESPGSTAGRVRKIPWQYDGEPAQRTARLIYALFDNLGPRASWKDARHKDLSPQAFSALVQQSLNSWVAIQHDVHAARWDPQSPSALEAYAKFWREMPPSPERAPVLVFVNVVFPRAEAAGWKKLIPGASIIASRRKKAFFDYLKSLEPLAGIPCRVLAELPPVTREDILEWFSLNHIHDSEEKRIRAADRLFPPDANRPRAMWEIETFCAEELAACARDRGQPAPAASLSSFDRAFASRAT